MFNKKEINRAEFKDAVEKVTKLRVKISINFDLLFKKLLTNWDIGF